ncbi:hypothetical protein [Amycolatopsis echigonensis]|uniref:hypothetical protein n=1 Tax=Amycolatopsis echigonensis TaxID=2576905 RepID=UPI001FE9CCCB|nr:hypothetical protein [Amycolatopsis echigonensis]
MGEPQPGAGCLDARSAPRDRQYRGGVLVPAGMKVGPSQQRRCARRSRGKLLAQTALVQFIGDPRGAPVVVDRNGEHELCGSQRRGVECVQFAQPTVGYVEVAALQDGQHCAFRRGSGVVECACAQELFGGFLVVTFVCEEIGASVAQPPHLGRIQPCQPFEQVLAEPRMTPQLTSTRVPAHRKVGRAQLHHQVTRMRDAECGCAGGADLVKQRGSYQEIDCFRGELAKDVRREVSVQRIRFSSGPGDMVCGAPCFEQDAGSPAAGHLDHFGFVQPDPPERGQSGGSLVRSEREVVLAHGREHGVRRQRAKRGGDLAPAGQDDSHGRRSVTY